jgi:hypothetical protein
MISKYKLYKIALVSTAMILMLVNIVGAKSDNHDGRTCGCGDQICGCGDQTSGCGDPNLGYGYSSYGCGYSSCNCRVKICGC